MKLNVINNKTKKTVTCMDLWTTLILISPLGATCGPNTKLAAVPIHHFKFTLDFLFLGIIIISI